MVELLDNSCRFRGSAGPPPASSRLLLLPQDVPSLTQRGSNKNKAISNSGADPGVPLQNGLRSLNEDEVSLEVH